MDVDSNFIHNCQNIHKGHPHSAWKKQTWTNLDRIYKDAYIALQCILYFANVYLVSVGKNPLKSTYFCLLFMTAIFFAHRENTALVKILYRLKMHHFHLLVKKKQLSSELCHQGKNEISEPKPGNIGVLSNYLTF